MEEHKYKMGAIPSPPEVWDYSVRITMAAFPQEWRQIEISKHYEQQSNTCVPQTMRWIYYLAYGADFGVNYLYAGGRSHTAPGMYINEALNFLAASGSPRLPDDPYELEVPEAIYYYESNKAVQLPKAQPFAGCTWARVDTQEQIKQALITTHKLAKGSHLPVSATLAVETWEPQSNGIWRCQSPKIGYHQVLVKGWLLVDGKEYAIIHNSWGNKWGRKGDAYVPWEDVVRVGAFVVIPKAVEIADEVQIIRRTLRLKSPYMRDAGGYTDVMECQKKLTAHGYPCGTLDGIFGSKTNNAVLAFQQAKGLIVDGICGPKTWAALDEDPMEQELPASWRQLLCQWTASMIGQVYVWGGQGEDLTAMSDPEAWIKKRETSKENANRAIAFYHEALKTGKKTIRAFDCSGLIVRFLQDNDLVKNDMSSRGLYSASSKLDREDLVPGDLVFRYNSVRIYHVGVYVGSGMVAEAKGRDDGVVVRDINASGKTYWNRYGRLKVLE
ncbi:MAG: peptidoglycan-binding protein [Candidatus Pelethousia sp.]|nr:peptidoglycan-binding protein [Candidatus Pelethousia sp.]